jgi:hypothetical protein
MEEECAGLEACLKALIVRKRDATLMKTILRERSLVVLDEEFENDLDAGAIQHAAFEANPKRAN